MKNITRVEIIGPAGREFSKWLKTGHYKMSIQDDGRTLKLFETDIPTQGFNMTYTELNILQKFIDNRVDYTLFETFMQRSGYGADYIELQWNKFRDNPIRFITSRDERVLFAQIQIYIKGINYKG